MSTLEGSTLSQSPFIPNPLPGHNMSIKEMYDLVNKQDGSWGINGYKVPQEYLDSRELKQIREGNPKKNAPKPTKKGDYLTEITKVSKALPAPNQYNIVQPWVDEKDKKKPPKVGNRTTFLEDIAIEAKRRPVPGPGTYDVLKASKKKEGAPKKGSERDNFLFDVQYLSNTIPGPGNYNPRQIQPKIKEAKLKPEDWRKKHKEESTKKVTLPEVGTYTPSPANFDTFDKIADKQKSGKGNGKKNWGTEVRFDFDKKTGKKIEGPPGPGQYNMIASWSPLPAKGGKEEKKDGTHVYGQITKGISKSIYYS